MNQINSNQNNKISNRYVGAYRFYDYHNFHNDKDCKDFFLDPINAPLFGYPSSSDAETYCQSFKWSLAGATGVFIAMHFMIIVAARTYSENMHRSSAIFEPLDPAGLGGAGGRPEEETSVDDSNILRQSFEVKPSSEGEDVF